MSNSQKELDDELKEASEKLKEVVAKLEEKESLKIRNLRILKGLYDKRTKNR